MPSWRPVDTAWVRSPSGREVGFPLPRGQGQFVVAAPRPARCRAGGRGPARWCQGARRARLRRCGRTERRRDRDRRRCPGSIMARYVVAADGMWSPVRKALGLGEPGYLGEWHTFRQYFDGVTGNAADRLWVWFEPDLLPGYAWSFPLPGGRANVGFGVLRGAEGRIQDMKDLWPDLLARPHVREALGPGARPSAPHKAWPIRPASTGPGGGGAHAVRRRRRRRLRSARRGRASVRPSSPARWRRRPSSRPEPSGPAGGGALLRSRGGGVAAGPPDGRRALPTAEHESVARAAIRVAGSSAWTRPELRPLALRGRAAGGRAHARALAPPLPGPRTGAYA